ncbi:hypothetical protein ACHAQH_001897 [Verticillium albo-atrum]
MAPQNIIADSDDEDDLTPGQSPVKPQTPAITQDLRSPATGNGTGSTDPRFFQAIYSEQQQAVAGATLVRPDQSFDPANTTSSSNSLHVNLQRKTGIENTSSLSSATDSVSKRPRSTHPTSPSGVIQNSMPGSHAASTMKDVWDIPSSPETAALPIPKRSLVSQAKAPIKTSTKNSNGEEYFSPTVEAPSHDATSEGKVMSTTPRSAERQSIEPHQFTSSTQQNSPNRIIEAQGCPISGQKPAAPLASESVTSKQTDPRPGQASISIEPMTLSTSQRALYQSIHPSPEEAAGQDFDAAAHFRQAMSGIRSSGATTIAYATPSQWHKSSHPVAPEPKEVSSPATGRKKRARASYAEPASSPDLLAAEQRPEKRGKATKKKVDGVGTGRSVSHQVMDSDEDEDDENFTTEAYQPRPSWRRAISARLLGVEGNAEEEQMAALAAATHVAETQEPSKTLLTAEPEHLPPRRKRGRPRKSEVPPAPQVSDPVEDTLQHGDAEGKPDVTVQSFDAIDTGQQVPTPPEIVKPGKRKRGRPRKSDKMPTSKAVPGEGPVETPVVCISDVAGGTEIDEAATVGPPGGLPEEDATRAATKAYPHAQVDMETLGEASGSSIKTADEAVKIDIVIGQQDNRDEMEATPGKSKAKDQAAKPTKREPCLPVTPQAGRPLYRVGLSKRSRIAPLLKSLRKT